MMEAKHKNIFGIAAVLLAASLLRQVSQSVLLLQFFWLAAALLLGFFGKLRPALLRPVRAKDLLLSAGGAVLLWCAALLLSRGAGIPSLSALLLSCLLAPLCEEAFFRGSVLTALLPWDELTAICGSALVFAMMHARPRQMLFAFLCGLLLGWFSRRAGLLPCVLLHALLNLSLILPIF